MQYTLDKIFEKYGTPISIQHGKSTVWVRGFFQPDRSKSWQSVVDVATPLGEIARRNFVYIGPAVRDVEDGDLLTVDGKGYSMRRVERYYFGDSAAYMWALCVEKGGDETWKNQS